MRIIQQTPTVLNLQVQKYSESLLTGLPFGLVFLLVGLKISFGGDYLTILKCNRIEPTQINCEIVAKNWLGQQTDPIPVTNLQGSQVEVNDDSDGDTYRIVLMTQNSQIPLTNSYSSGLGTNHYENNLLINSFIQASEQNSLTIQQDDRLIVMLGLVLAFPGFLFTIYELKAKNITHCLFDKTSNQLCITKRNILKSEQEEKSLTEVKKVEVTEDVEDGKTISLVLMTGDNFVLKTQKEQKNYDQIAQSINQFLEV